MRKLLPLVLSGIAAISFSAFAADPSVDANKGQGRSVDTGGGRPDSSKAEGTEPVTSSTPGMKSDSNASTGSDPSTGSDMKQKRSERKDKRDADANAGASSNTSTPMGGTGTGTGAAAGASTTAPTSPQGGSAPASSTPGSLGSPNSGASK